MLKWPLLVLSLVTSTSSSSSCPTDFCTCKWKSGKETTECTHQEFDDIPRGLPQGTQILDLRGNVIRSLRDDIFVRRKITHVQRLYLRDCELNEIEANAFNRLTNLVELDVGGNRLREIPTEAWKKSESLMRLHLSDNPIKLIRRGAFRQLGQLSLLGLSRCRLETIEEGAFDGLEALKELRLDGNRLNYLQGARLFPAGLAQVEVSVSQRRMSGKNFFVGYNNKRSRVCDASRRIGPSLIRLHDPRKRKESWENRKKTRLFIPVFFCLF